MSTTRLRWVLKYTASGPSPTCENRTIENSEEWGVLKTTAIQWTGWNASEHKTLPQEYWGAKHLSVRKGDVLVTKAGPRNRVGVSAYVDRTEPRIIVSGKMLLLRADESAVDPRYLNWQLSTPLPQAYLNSCKTGMAEAQMNFANEDLLGMDISLPSLDEQRRIADFLDYETAQIDHLDALALNTADLLAERRKVLIEHVIIGETAPNRKLFRGLQLLRDGTHQPPSRTETGIPLLTARNVSSGLLRLTDQDTFVSPEDAEILERSLRPNSGDVLLSVKGTVGASAIVPADFPRTVLDRNLALLRPQSSLLSEWLIWVLRTRSLQDQMRLSVVAAAQPGLPLGAIRELRIPSAEITEQKSHLKEIKAIDQPLTDLESKIRHQRDLLAERRQALITAAVTGGITV